MADDLVRFLIRDMKPDLRLALELDARAAETSLQEIIRQTLCSHYRLRCEPLGASSRAWNGAPTILLKLQPKVFAKIKQDAEKSKIPMRSTVLRILERRYVTEGVS